jgi:uncharacterized protein
VRAATQPKATTRPEGKPASPARPAHRYAGTRARPDDLPKDSGILRTAAQHNAVNVGVYASVLSGGSIRRGNAVTLA